jgi:outer membrane murein-binding lipoprotein Lpp
VTATLLLAGGVSSKLILEIVTSAANLTVKLI